MIQDFITYLSQSAAFEAQIEALGQEWNIGACTRKQDETPYFIEDQSIEVVLTGLQSVDILHLIAAIRDAWHEQREDIHSHVLHPTAYILQERVRQADIVAFTIRVAWEMRNCDDFDIWRAVLASAQGDVAMMYQNIMARNPLDFCLENAMEAAFIHWFSDWKRVSQTDRDSLSLMDQLIEDYDPEEAVISVQAPHTISRTDLVNMGCQMDSGLTYLSRIAHDLQNDPYFSGMEDNVNKTYLSHIIRDLATIRVHNIAFRDGLLAQRLFPSHEVMAYN